MVRPDGSEIIPPEQIETIVRAVRELDSVQVSTFLAVCASHEALRAERDAIDQALRGYCEGDSAARSGCASIVIAAVATLVAILGLALWIGLSGCTLALEHERVHAAENAQPTGEGVEP